MCYAACSAHGGQRSVSNYQGVKLEITMSCHVDTGTWIQVLEKNHLSQPYVAQIDHQLFILWLQPAEHWDYSMCRHAQQKTLYIT